MVDCFSPFLEKLNLEDFFYLIYRNVIQEGVKNCVEIPLQGIFFGLSGGFLEKTTECSGPASPEALHDESH